jgi:NAD+ diphosphatase
MDYPEAVNLPFNGNAIKEGYRMIRHGEELPATEPLWLPIRRGCLLVRDDGGSPALLGGELPLDPAGVTRSLCIGSWYGRPLMALELQGDTPLPPGLLAEPFNAERDWLDDAILSLGGMAHQVLAWERTSLICSLCGTATLPIPLTWGKRCPSCRHEHFPHIHPCIIVLVRRGHRFLLVRKPNWPPGRYSLVAGFLDFGESLEECVQREVREETGLEVGDVRYVGSQNWPFPSQLMAGFVAEYVGGELQVDGVELEDGRWFTPTAPPPSLPGRRSIARWIIERFALDQGGRRVP